MRVYAVISTYLPRTVTAMDDEMPFQGSTLPHLPTNYYLPLHIICLAYIPTYFYCLFLLRITTFRLFPSPFLTIQSIRRPLPLAGYRFTVM